MLLAPGAWPTPAGSLDGHPPSATPHPDTGPPLPRDAPHPRARRSQRAREAALRPDPRYLEAQAAAAAGSAPWACDALTPQMRMIVASWMVEVADEFSLQPETLHLAVSLLDRFLSATVPQGVPRGVLQMVAVACVMVAAKHLEVGRPGAARRPPAAAARAGDGPTLLSSSSAPRPPASRASQSKRRFSAPHPPVAPRPRAPPRARAAPQVSHPSVEQLVAIAANCFSAQDLLRMERVLLDALDFGVAAPTGFTFLHLYAQGLRGLQPPVAALAVYLLDVALLDYSLLEFPPSLLAAAALALSMHTHGLAAGAARALELAGYPARDAARATRCLLALHQNAAWPAGEAVRDLLAPLATKYSQPAWCCAALCQPLPALDAGWFA